MYRPVVVLISAAALVLGGCGPEDRAAGPPEVLATSAPRGTAHATVRATPVATTPTSSRRTRVARIRPRIQRRPIPFGVTRRAEMRAYSKRHYGVATAALDDPRVIVMHYTVAPTFQATYDIFARDVRDPGLGELPGTCTHFVIDRDGTIRQLVPLALRCRHTVGLNWTAIGIEHVGNADADVVDRPAVRRASLRLVRWLRCRYGIRRRDVIGHAESLTSPYHRERVARFRKQTHADMQRPAMDRLRGLMGACP